MTPFAETDRLVLRALERHELPRLVELLDVWDIVRWLSVVSYPYTMQNAEEFYADMEQAMANGVPQFFAMALKSDNLLIGGIGLHPPRGSTAVEGEVEIGYWLGRAFWGRGLMSEAARVVAGVGFSRPSTRTLISTTDVNNVASQNVLSKIGMKNMGVCIRDYPALRGDDHVVRWQMTREEWERTNDKA
ncbi:MAG: GNAT family N-acetyltransferase [Bdellovibrionales bacterium]